MSLLRRTIYKPAHTEKFFRNLIKSTWNQIIFTIFRLIWIETEVRLDPNQSENGEYNLISGWFNKIQKRFLCLYLYIISRILRKFGIYHDGIEGLSSQTEKKQLKKKSGVNLSEKLGPSTSGSPNWGNPWNSSNITALWYRGVSVARTANVEFFQMLFQKMSERDAW